MFQTISTTQGRELEAAIHWTKGPGAWSRQGLKIIPKQVLEASHVTPEIQIST